MSLLPTYTLRISLSQIGVSVVRGRGTLPTGPVGNPDTTSPWNIFSERAVEGAETIVQEAGHLPCTLLIWFDLQHPIWFLEPTRSDLWAQNIARCGPQTRNKTKKPRSYLLTGPYIQNDVRTKVEIYFPKQAWNKLRMGGATVDYKSGISTKVLVCDLWYCMVPCASTSVTLATPKIWAWIYCISFVGVWSVQVLLLTAQRALLGGHDIL